jgi:imidazole glycerol-phosphate synthase subunit HisH
MLPLAKRMSSDFSRKREAEVSVAIVDYGSGNLHSAHKAFERAAREAGLERTVVVTSRPEVVAAADHIVLPGVGAFADCRRGLDGVGGMVEALEEAVRGRGRPFLGICVGMQLMASRGLEYETTRGLNWIPGDVAAIQSNDPSLKIPHMGWNNLEQLRPHPVLNDIQTGDKGLHAYFVHSFQLFPAASSDVIAVADYGGPISAIVGRDNMIGVQFHPEKSQKLGLALISNFLKWRP